MQPNVAGPVAGPRARKLGGRARLLRGLFDRLDLDRRAVERAGDLHLVADMAERLVGLVEVVELLVGVVVEDDLAALLVGALLGAFLGVLRVRTLGAAMAVGDPAGPGLAGEHRHREERHDQNHEHRNGDLTHVDSLLFLGRRYEAVQIAGSLGRRECIACASQIPGRGALPHELEGAAMARYHPMSLPKRPWRGPPPPGRYDARRAARSRHRE